MSYTWADIERVLGDNLVEVVRAQELLAFAAGVLHQDVEERCTWVVCRAVDRATQTLVDVVDDFQNVNATAAIEATVIVSLGLSGVREALLCPSDVYVPSHDVTDKETPSRDFAGVRIQKAADALKEIVREAHQSGQRAVNV